MQEVKLDPAIEKLEQDQAAIRKAEKERFDAAMEEFRQSMAYRYVMGFFDKAEERIIGEIDAIQKKNMAEIFMLTGAERTKKITEMSKRDIILTGVLGILKEVKNKL